MRDSSSRRKRIHDYKNWNYNVGAGANLDSGPTRTWVRQGGFVAAAGVARNANKYLGLRADFMFANLPLRDSTQNLALATGRHNPCLFPYPGSHHQHPGDQRI